MSDVKCSSDSFFQSFQTLFCDKYFGDMIVYGTVYLKIVKSICI